MPVTIRDVAERLDLSITTVSRALNGFDDVAEATRRRVVEASREMGYVATHSARQLRRQKTEAIGWILPTPQPRFTDPFFAHFLAGLGDEAAAHGLDLLVSTARAGQDETEHYQRWARGRRVDGMVLVRLRLEDWRVDFLAEQGMPFVAFGRTRHPQQFPWVDVDGHHGMLQLVRHLVGLGHRRIAFIGASAEFTFQMHRLDGYREGLGEAGLAFDPQLVTEGDLTRAGGHQAAQRLLELTDPPTAVIGANDLTALGVMRAARERGQVIGQDLAVAGYDGTEAAEHADPPLTTLGQPIYESARRVCGLLAQRLQGEPPEESHILIQPRLIVRGSTTG